jgi:hypothetical protein
MAGLKPKNLFFHADRPRHADHNFLSHLPASGQAPFVWIGIVMPEVLEQPRLLHPALLALPPLSGLAIMTISGILKAPPDQPNLPTVINVLVCLRH